MSGNILTKHSLSLHGGIKMGKKYCDRSLFFNWNKILTQLLEWSNKPSKFETKLTTSFEKSDFVCVILQPVTS